MRGFYLVLLIAALMLGLPCRPAYAIGDVLVPSDDDNPPAASGKTAAPPASSGEAPGETNLPMTDGSADMPSDPSNPGSLGYTPIPPSLMPSATLNIPKPPTQVVKMAAGQAFSDPSDTTLTNSLNVSLQKYLWGPDDVASVNSSLGIPADQVSKSCQLEAVGTLLSDSGGYIFDVGGSRSQAVLHYGGKPSGINVTARAMCDTVPLPPNSGTVLQIGDKYAVYITQIQCPPPPADARGLVFQYAGNGKAQCAYQ